MEQPAAGIRSKRVGLVIAASGFGRKADAVPAAPERRQELRLRELDFARRQSPADCLGGYHNDAEDSHWHRRTQTSDELGNHDCNAGAEHRMRPAEREELDGDELSVLGGANRLWRKPQRGRISGDDRLLRTSLSLQRDLYKCFISLP